MTALVRKPIALMKRIQGAGGNDERAHSKRRLNTQELSAGREVQTAKATANQITNFLDLVSIWLKFIEKNHIFSLGR